MEALYIIKFIIIVFFLIFFNLTIVYLFVKKLYFTRKFKSDEELDEYYSSLEKIFTTLGIKKFINIISKEKKWIQKKN